MYNTTNHNQKETKYDIHHLPLTCTLDGPIPDPRKIKQQTRSDHVAHYHTKYGGSMNFAWFSRLNLPPAVQKLMCYPESCLLVNEAGDAVGKMYTSITMNEWANQPCLLVHSGCFAKLRQGLEVGTDITGFITGDMRVIQELGHEWARIDGVMLDRKTFLMNEPDGKLFCQIVLRKDDVVKHDKISFIPFGDLTTFVSEATNILLQRLIVQQKKTGEIDLKCLTTNGKVVKCNYRLLGDGYENVKGEDVKVWGIRRSVWTEKGVYCWDSLFNYYGRLVLRCQPENHFAMIPLWFKPMEEFDEMGNFIGMLPPLVWGCDPQLYSDYMIRKTELSAEYKKYLIDHPDLRAILSDFLQKILLQRPRNIIEFSKNYFQPFVKIKPESAKTTSEQGSVAAAVSSSSSSSSSSSEYEGEGQYKEYPQGLSYLYPEGRPYLLEDYLEEEQEGEYVTNELLLPRPFSGSSGSASGDEPLPASTSGDEKEVLEPLPTSSDYDTEYSELEPTYNASPSEYSDPDDYNYPTEQT